MAHRRSLHSLRAADKRQVDPSSGAWARSRRPIGIVRSLLTAALVEGGPGHTEEPCRGSVSSRERATNGSRQPAAASASSGSVPGSPTKREGAHNRVAVLGLGAGRQRRGGAHDRDPKDPGEIQQSPDLPCRTRAAMVRGRRPRAGHRLRRRPSGPEIPARQGRVALETNCDETERCVEAEEAAQRAARKGEPTEATEAPTGGPH